jgi:hypothetical protein
MLLLAKLGTFKSERGGVYVLTEWCVEEGLNIAVLIVLLKNECGSESN